MDLLLKEINEIGALLDVLNGFSYVAPEDFDLFDSNGEKIGKVNKLSGTEWRLETRPEE